MILSTPISKELTPAESQAVDSAPKHCALVGAPKPDHASCRLQIERIVREIDDPEVRAIVHGVFTDLLRLLECLSLTESHLRQVEGTEETFAVFQLIHDEALGLVKFIRDEGLTCPVMSEELTDTLDGITFAISHDLQRVFETEQQAEKPDSTPHLMVGKAYRAHDLLTNCLQQSTITLAMMFDPELAAGQLFNTSDMRYRQSLQLCNDLTALLQLVETTEKTIDGPGFDSLAARLERFRKESLECLIYSDWPQFESFCERINLAGTSALELEPVLHQFRCYLEALLGQVRMRAVLGSGSSRGFGADQTDTPPPRAIEFLTQFSSSLFPDNTDQAWDLLAVA